jgi:hypothetical protein
VWPAIWVFAVTLLASGCGSNGDLLPVSGTVTLDGQPLKAGSVQFQPDASRNKSQDIPAGKIVDGKYEMSTRGKKGAPPGWYKVVVRADQFSGDNAPKRGGTVEAPKSLISLKYANAATTPLSKEVVANPAPDAYDLQVTK